MCFLNWNMALRIVLVVITLGCSAQQGWAQTSGQGALDRARGALLQSASNDCAAPNSEAIAALRRGVEAFHTGSDTASEAQALRALGVLYDSMGKYEAAIPVLQRAAGITTDGRLRVEAKTILADALQSVGRATEALDILRSAIEEAHRMGDPILEADAFRIRGETKYGQSRGDAMADFESARSVLSDGQGLKIQAEIANDEGVIESESHHPDQAFGLFTNANEIAGRIHDCRDQAQVFSNLGSLEEDRGQAGRALDAYNQALPLERQVGDRDSESKTLHALAKMHHDLGNLQEALKLFEQALAVEDETGDVEAQGNTQVAIAGVYRDLYKLPEARQRYRAALPRLRAADRAYAMNNLAAVEAELGHRTSARSYYRQAIQAAARAKDSILPAYSAWGIGELEQADALKSYFSALRLADQMDMPDLQGLVATSLMDHFRRKQMPDLAIFFGKQAVDDYQALRGNLSEMTDATVSSFVQEKAHTYRTLARLLADEGRLIEAQQVLNLLKIQQYADYMQWQGDIPSATMARTRAEQRLEAEYRTKAADLAAAAKASPGELTGADRAMTAFLDNVPQQLGTEAAGTSQETGLQKALDAALAEHPDTAIVFTLVNEDRYTAIVLTRTSRVMRSFPVAQATLDAECREFLRILRTHQQRPEAAAEELFRVVVAPVERDLESSGATTVIWSLDGPLRFIPIAALMNPQTKTWLIQNYTVANYSPLGNFETEPPRLAHASAVAMGTSTNYDPALSPLPNVPEELSKIVTDPGVHGSKGPLPGRILLDEDFTRAAMERNVHSQTVVHIASHFVLEPGNDSLSYLLVGGMPGNPADHRFSLADFKLDHELKIGGTDLVTLSACETGAENLRDDGVVMEGLSEAVLDKQAEAVIASLWAVNDQSTAALMARFYDSWIGSGGKISKSEALRRAQLDLMRGDLRPDANAGNRGLTAGASGASARFADPYYWAPFVLTGNWQ
jgi:CHAT domain-containing protein/Tfp pilus assembly protein PilF